MWPSSEVYLFQKVIFEENVKLNKNYEQQWGFECRKLNHYIWRVWPA